MSLFAMVSGGQRFANYHRMVANVGWVVPTGVTTVYVNAGAAGGGPGVTSTPGGKGGGGGGGGGSIIFAPLTVTPADTLTLTSASNGDILQPATRWTVRDSALNTLFFLDEGASPGSPNDTRSGQGGRVSWVQSPAAAVSGGFYTVIDGGVGDPGSVASVGTGFIVSGGAGGAGNQIIPPAAGGAGGVDGLGNAGPAPVDYWGGGGGGVYFSGSSRLSGSSGTATGTTFVDLYW